MRDLLKHIKSYIWSKRNYKIFINELFNKQSLKKINHLFDTMYFEKYVRPIEQLTPLNKNIVVIAPHPDDEVLGCGGLIIKSLQNNCKISLIFLTSGLNSDREVRENEALKVASKLGIDDVTFLRINDGKVFNELSFNKIKGKLESIKPDIILIPFIFDKHDDHISSNKFIPDIPSNLKIEIWCYQVYSTMSCNAYIDITDIAEEKYRAISMYQSQMNNFDYVNWNRGLNAFNSRYSHNKEKKYIESYFIFPLDEYQAVCTQYFNES